MVLFPAVNLTAIPWDFGLILAVLGIVIPWRGTVRVGRLMKMERSGRLRPPVALCNDHHLSMGHRGARLLEGAGTRDEYRRAWRGGIRSVAICMDDFRPDLALVRGPDCGLAKDGPDSRLRTEGPLFRITEKIMPRTWTEGIVFAALAGTAGLSEEFLYRGFLLAVFANVFTNTAGSVLIASCLSSLWFAVAHLYQGRRGSITTFVVAMIFASVRVWSGSLLPSIVAHAAVDLVVGLYVPRLLRKT